MQVVNWLLAAVIVPSALSLLKCEKTSRGRVKFYFDPYDLTCFALPVDCDTGLKVSYKLYDTEEECTLENMVRLWRSYQLTCPFEQRMAVYRRSNGDLMPYIFSSKLCKSRDMSDICNQDESCYTHGGFGYCCRNTAYKGEGPNSGTFNFTAIGGKSRMLFGNSVTAATRPPPRDCNLDGDRKEVEWYPRPGMACLSRRKICSSPYFSRDVNVKTYATQQECMNAHFPNLRMSYRLTCTPGQSPAKADAALIFSKDQCGSMHHSDMCNRNEYCAYKNGSPYAFCCEKSNNSSVISYTVYGNNFRRRNKRHSSRIVISF